MGYNGIYSDLYRGLTNFILPCSTTKLAAAGKTGSYSALIPIWYHLNRTSELREAVN